MLLILLLHLCLAPNANTVEVLGFQHHLQPFRWHVPAFLLVLHEIGAFVIVKYVLLHEAIAKEALDELLRAALSMHSQLFLGELLEAQPALEALLLHCHVLAHLAVK